MRMRVRYATGVTQEREGGREEGRKKAKKKKKYNVSRRKKILKIRTEINQIETKKISMKLKVDSLKR